MCVRTSIDIDERAVREVQRLTGARSKREAVDIALRELIARESRAEILSVRGRVRWEGDLGSSRTGRH